VMGVASIGRRVTLWVACLLVGRPLRAGRRSLPQERLSPHRPEVSCGSCQTSAPDALAPSTRQRNF
jgi:hypothetical protein